MSTYAIGDVQGCRAELERLLELVGFDPANDRVVLVGDLVNRGPESLATLRLVRSLGGAAATVLGNHDLHLLATATGARAPRGKDTLDDVLAAPDREALLDWLRARPLLLVVPETGHVVVHAGIPPAWDLADARRTAGELEAVLRGPRWMEFLEHMYGDGPEQWGEALTGWDRLRYVTNAFTRMRYVREDGALDLDAKGPPDAEPAGLVPWFAHPARRTAGTPIVFGHWATLQTRSPVDAAHGVVHVDAGCVWGGALRAVRLEDGRVFEVPGLDPPRQRASGRGASPTRARGR